MTKKPRGPGGIRIRSDMAPDGLRRERDLRVPLSPAESDAIEEAAEEAGESQAEFARVAIAERIARQPK